MRSAILALVAASVAAAAPSPSFNERRLAIIDAYARFKRPGDYGYAEIAAKLWRNFSTTPVQSASARSYLPIAV